MAKKPTLYVRDKMYIPIKMLPMDPEDAVAEYTVHDYDEKICRMCDYKRDRYSDICGECEKGGYKGATVFAKEKVIDGKKHLAFPIGDRLNIERRLRIDLSDFKIKDLRTKAPFDYKVKFIGKLRDYQIDLLKKWVKFKHGLIKAPPRTGKTITSIAICIELGQRVVIMANQVDFLENFMEEIAAHTNLPRLEEKYGKKLFGFLNKPEDYENFQIGFATYQSFISDNNGKRRLKLLQKNFGTLWIDECFTYDHRIQTEKGLVQIGDVVTGKVDVEFVLSKNLTTGQREYKHIESFTRKTVKQLCKVHTPIGVFTCTPTHLFWSNTRNSYVEAQNLTVDDDLDLSQYV